MPPSTSAGSDIGNVDFIERHGLWTDAQKEAAQAMSARVRSEGLRSIRVSTADPHGKLRGKTILASMMDSVLRNGVDFSTAIYHFDTSDAIVYNAFAADGGLGDTALAGFPDVVLVPDPETFTVLPYAPGTGWCLGNMYFNDGTPVPFDARHQLRRQLKTLEADFGFRYLVGLEVEFYLTKVVDGGMRLDDMGGPGMPPAPPIVAPVGPGYAYQSEDHQDQIEWALAQLADNLIAAGLPLRTMEDEWGPGQCEFTFSPLEGVTGADAMLLFKTVIKQASRRIGLHASFMCRPNLPGFYASGWHLHQSLLDSEGANAFVAPAGSQEVMSKTGMQFAAGLLDHALEASVLTTPTINGYRRRKPYSLAPDRSTWGIDNRAAMLRVQGGPGDIATHIENRVGEPAANPYLYLASQLAAGMDGLASALDPGPPEAEPYTAEHRPLLPTTLMEAMPLFTDSGLYRSTFGDSFVDWLAGLKESEIARFQAAEGDGWDPEVVTDWEHREYFTQY